MLQSVIGRRLLTLNVFSNTWTSQSGAENTNSIWQKLSIGASHSLAVVVDKVMAYLEREETRNKEKKNSKANLSSLVSPLADQLSQKAFAMILVQFNEGLNYEAVPQTDTTWLVSRKGLKDGQDALPRTVHLVESSWICSCNMPVYLGITCRHVQCVMVKLHLAIPVESIHPRWLKNALQPQVIFKNKSPFQSRQPSILVDVGQDHNQLEEQQNLESESGDFDFLASGPGDFDQFLHDNGGEFGNDSLMDSADVVVLDGGAGKQLEKIKPKERRNELTNHFYQLVQRIGFGKGSKELMDDLEQCLTNWEDKHLKETDGLGLAPSRAATRARVEAWKSASQIKCCQDKEDLQVRHLWQDWAYSWLKVSREVLGLSQRNKKPQKG